MALWRLQTLGEPALTPQLATASAVGFQYYRTWLLLASLALSSRPLSRDDLAERLWPDRDLIAGRHQLRTILRDLLHGDRRRGTLGIGKENLQCSRDSLALRPHFITTDYAEVQALWTESQKLREQGNLAACASCLHDAAVLFDGPFLNLKGLDSGAESWLAQMRSAIDSLETAVWQQQYDVQQALGDKRDARALWESHLHLFGPQEVPTRALSKLSWGELVSQLEHLGQQNLLFTVKEERLLLESLAENLSTLPTQVSAAFRRLSIFPQAFTVHQATRIARIEPDHLGLLANAHLLRRAGDRYEMPAAVRSLVWKRLASVQRQRLSERHTRHFQLHDGDGWPGDGYGNSYPDDCVRWRTEERENYLQVLDACLQKPLDVKAVHFIDSLQHVLYVEPTETAPRFDVLRRSRFRLEEFTLSGLPQEKYRCSLMLALLALMEGAFAQAVYSARASFAAYRQSAHPDFIPGTTQILLPLLSATHHAGLHSEFDQTMELTLRIAQGIPEIEPRPLEKKGFIRHVYGILAENQYARGNLEAALESNTRARELETQLVGWGALPAAQTGNRYQRGCILRALKRPEEALPFFDTALRLFEESDAQHGVADCLQNIGAIGGEMGMVGIARRDIEQSIAIYTELGEAGSRAAALGTLGDLLAQVGDMTEARRLYHEGLDFWRSARHEQWTQRFERRLTDLDTLQPQKTPEMVS